MGRGVDPSRRRPRLPARARTGSGPRTRRAQTALFVGPASSVAVPTARGSRRAGRRPCLATAAPGRATSQSIAFFSTPGIDELYSGDDTRTTRAAPMRSRMSDTPRGNPSAASASPVVERDVLRLEVEQIDVGAQGLRVLHGERDELPVERAGPEGAGEREHAVRHETREPTPSARRGVRRHAVFAATAKSRSHSRAATHLASRNPVPWSWGSRAHGRSPGNASVCATRPQA